MQLDIHPSRYLLAFLVLVHVGAMLCILTLPLQWWAILIINICLLGNFIYNERRYVKRRTPETIIKVWLDENKVWHILQRNGDVSTVRLLGDSVCSKIVVILNFQVIAGKNSNKKYSVIIFPDSVPVNNYRQLRKWMNSQ